VLKKRCPLPKKLRDEYNFQVLENWTESQVISGLVAIRVARRWTQNRLARELKISPKKLKQFWEGEKSLTLREVARFFYLLGFLVDFQMVSLKKIRREISK